MRLFISILTSFIFSSFRMSEARARHSASAFISDEPIMSASHCVNCLKRDEDVGSSLKTSPIWYLLNGSFRFGFCFNILASWNVNSYLKPRERSPLSFSLNLSETASSSDVSDSIKLSNSTIGVSTREKP